MNAVVVYESLWGNTAAVAKAIAEGLGPDVPALATDEATEGALRGVDLIVAFETRISWSPRGAVTDIARRLKRAGYTPAAEPERAAATRRIMPA